MATIRKRNLHHRTPTSELRVKSFGITKNTAWVPPTPAPGRYNEHNIWIDQARLHLECQFDDLVYKTLPRLAREHKWVITEDHCFMRVLYDNAFGDAWYKCLPKHHDRVLRRIPTAVLQEAVRIGGELVLYNGVDLDKLNHNSLLWRGKLK
jgi:hypothetical protein